ncbi:MAG: hypothetical protein IJ837_03185 [Clostridia bacterium]|nr:hypothetical protein [Clostridia bacterium]
MKTKPLNDYTEKNFEILNAKKFLMTFYEEKALSDFYVSDETNNLIMEMFFLFEKQYSVDLPYGNEFDNENILTKAICCMPNEIPFDQKDEKEVKEIIKLSRIIEKNMIRTLNAKQDVLYNSVFDFWFAENKQRQDELIDVQINHSGEYDALLKSANNSYEILMFKEKTPLKKMKDCVNFSKKSDNQEFKLK